jgi:hypothetical protein
MKNAEKTVSLQKYAQNLKDRISAAKYTKRDNSAFLKLDLAKTEKEIARRALLAPEVEKGGAKA